MKSLTHYIQEKLVIKKNKYNYFPQTKEELRNIIEQRMKKEGNEANLNDIDVSNITDMSRLFEGTKFNGDISNWNVSKVHDMSYMFYNCTNFNKDISSWDVSKVTYMSFMFYECNSFNQDISAWDVSNVIHMGGMFWGCSKFNQDISNWNVSKVKNMNKMFLACPIEEKYKPVQL